MESAEAKQYTISDFEIKETLGQGAFGIV